MIESWRRHYNKGEAACLAWLPSTGAGGRGACVSYTADWAAWRSADNPGGSIKPCHVFIGADVEHELTFGLDHAVGADQERLTNLR